MNTKNLLTAHRLKQCRTSVGKTLEQIGTLVGVHKTTVMRWEKGETERIGLPTIQHLANYYDVSPAWLMGADVPMREKSTNVNECREESYANTVPAIQTLTAEEEALLELYRSLPLEKQHLVLDMIKVALLSK